MARKMKSLYDKVWGFMEQLTRAGLDCSFPVIAGVTSAGIAKSQRIAQYRVNQVLSLLQREAKVILDPLGHWELSPSEIRRLQKEAREKSPTS